MYTPKAFLLKDTNEAFRFIQRFNFGLLTSFGGHRPIATHLPFVVENSEPKSLTSHLASKNPHAELLHNKAEHLLIFSEPHAYISPRHYTHSQNVPTWNYVAVHVYGTVKIICDFDEIMHHLENSIRFHEPEYMPQWQSISEKYKHDLVKELTAFSVEIKEIQATAKLSQNKSLEEIANIQNALAKKPETNAQLTAEYMRKYCPSKPN
ncbi:MAG: FMN-binding negative transcriptional regulator [Flavobacteriaceae bacterium]|nr:FMN-binding negative transcriptional regulator [Flavobacteriaceae bacterium]